MFWVKTCKKTVRSFLIRNKIHVDLPTSLDGIISHIRHHPDMPIILDFFDRCTVDVYVIDEERTIHPSTFCEKYICNYNFVFFLNTRLSTSNYNRLGLFKGRIG